MPTMTWNIGAQSAGATRSCVGFFCKPVQAPSAAMTLLDVDAGASGYWRFVLQPDLSVDLEVSLALLAGGTWGATVSSPALVLGEWSWISGDQADASKVNLGVTAVGGTVWSQATSGGSTPANQSYGVRVGWGASYSSSNLGFFSLPTGGEMSKLWFSYGTSPGTANTVALPMPLSDPTSGGDQPIVALYLCRETPGPVSTIADSGPDGYDMTAVGSATVQSDGPYGP